MISILMTSIEPNLKVCFGIVSVNLIGRVSKMELLVFDSHSVMTFVGLWIYKPYAWNALWHISFAWSCKYANVLCCKLYNFNHFGIAQWTSSFVLCFFLCPHYYNYFVCLYEAISNQVITGRL